MMKQESTTATTPVVCGNCGVEDRGLLHHVRHRGMFRRLCTTCILRLHPQSFCPTCFVVYDRSPPNDAVTCFKCYSSSHHTCVAGPTPSKTPYICPCCVNPNVPIFNPQREKDGESGNESGRVIDKKAAKVLVTAAKIASVSMNKAAVAARAEAERRAKEAAITRKRAREALEHVVSLTAIAKEKKNHKVVNDNNSSAVATMAVLNHTQKEGNRSVTGMGVPVDHTQKVDTSSVVATVAVLNHTLNEGNRSAVGMGVPVDHTQKVDTSSVRGTGVPVDHSVNDNNSSVMAMGVPVDRIVESSNEVLEALNAVELKENERVQGFKGESVLSEAVNDGVAMDVEDDQRKGIGCVSNNENEKSGDSTNVEDIEADKVSNGLPSIPLVRQQLPVERDHAIEENNVSQL